MNEAFWLMLAHRPDAVEFLQAGENFCKEYNRTCALASQQPALATEIVSDRAESRNLLLEALSQAQESVIIVSPWLNKRWVDDELLSQMEALLRRRCSLHIGWGYSGDISGIQSYGGLIHIQDNGKVLIQSSFKQMYRYSAYPELTKLRNRYSGQMYMKLLGTHEKYFVCDRRFAMLGSHNVLSSGDTASAPHECSWKTTDIRVINAQIARFHSLPDLCNTFRPQAQPSKIARFA